MPCSAMFHRIFVFLQIMSLLKQSFILIVCVVMVSELSAQQKLAGWVSELGFTRLSNKFTLETDATLHSTSGWQHIQSYQIWIGLLYYFNPHWNIGLGYSADVKRESEDGKNAYLPEHQVWEQLLCSYPWQLGKEAHGRKVNMIQRLRLEDRFIPVIAEDGNTLKAESSIFAARLRYLLRNQIPVLPSEVFLKGPYVVLQDEVFMNLNNYDKLNVKFLDQNRCFAAAGYRFAKSLDVEVGYQFQYTQTKTTDSKNNIIQLGALIHL